jgi:hypothetical protein
MIPRDDDDDNNDDDDDDDDDDGGTSVTNTSLALGPSLKRMASPGDR